MATWHGKSPSQAAAVSYGFLHPSPLLSPIFGETRRCGGATAGKNNVPSCYFLICGTLPPSPLLVLRRVLRLVLSLAGRRSTGGVSSGTSRGPCMYSRRTTGSRYVAHTRAQRERGGGSSKDRGRSVVVLSSCGTQSRWCRIVFVTHTNTAHRTRMLVPETRYFREKAMLRTRPLPGLH